jgi:hypothetical protein
MNHGGKTERDAKMRRLLFGLVVCLSMIVPTKAQVTYTHYVTPDGNSTSLCTESDPCNLWRAVNLLGGAHLPAGSVVHVAAGVYSHGQLIFKGSGTAAAPIKFIGNGQVRLSGTRVKPTVWTLVEGRTYTYETDWDEARFAVGTVAQRPPVATWRPIHVDDRLPPFAESLGRPFDLEFPVLFAPRSTVDRVEAQSCTYATDWSRNKVYVHMCHDGPPADPDNLYIAPANWGSVVIEGDYVWLEKIAIEHTSGTGLRVATSANGTVLKQITARAAQVWLEGTNTLAEDLDVSHVILQGAFPGRECYDANPEFGVGECWNAFGQGRALLIGREGSTFSYKQIVRRAAVHRSWNGARVDGRNTLEASSFWGFPNHTLEASGTGVTIRDSVFLSGQDSFFTKSNPLDDLTVERNIFMNAVYVTTSKDGTGGVRPTIGWRFKNNLLPILTLDRHTYETVSSDCNAYTGSGHLLRVITTSGVPGSSHETLGQIHANTSLEESSIALPPTLWAKARLLDHLMAQGSLTLDAADPLRVCGQRVGPS